MVHELKVHKLGTWVIIYRVILVPARLDTIYCNKENEMKGLM